MDYYLDANACEFIERRWPNAVWERAWHGCHADCDPQGNCNPDGAALISTRPMKFSGDDQ